MMSTGRAHADLDRFISGDAPPPNAEAPPSPNRNGQDKAEPRADNVPASPTERRLRLQRAGYSPIPVQGKLPAITKWQEQGQADQATIKAWERDHPASLSTGILTARTPCFDIDIKNPEAAEAVERLVREKLGDREGVFLVRFGNRPKRAIIFRTDSPFKKIQTSLTARDGSTDQKLEFLGDGQQMVAFGIHPITKIPYSWFGGAPGAVPRDELPHIDEEEARSLVEAGAQLLISDYGYAPKASSASSGNGQTGDPHIVGGGQPREWQEDIENIANGHELHDSIASLALKLVSSGMSEPAAINFIQAALDASTAPRDDRWNDRYKDVKRAVRTAQAKKEKKERAKQPAAERQKYTEDAIALMFAERHQADLRYVAALSEWQLWDGQIWGPEETRKCFDRARALCRELAIDCKNHRQAVTLRKASTVAAIERLAQSDRRLVGVIDQWDLDPKAFNAGGELINLETGDTRKTLAADYLTKLAGAPHCAKLGTAHPLWDAFLWRVTAGDSDLIDFLQRFMGYCLTGDVSEQVLVFLSGSGANGKSVFVNTVAKIFGTYSVGVPMEMFLTSFNDRHPAEIAKLRGARLAIAHETQKGRRWDEAKIKNLTGGDRISARFMRGEWFDFQPTHKLLIVGNNKPSLASVDEAIRRRFLLVPFTVQIPPDERDPHLVAKLEPEWPAILRWIVDGAIKWHDDGLMVPDVVRKATAEYMADQDALEQWFAECVVAYRDAFTKTGELFSSWKMWAERRNLPAGTMTAFAESLADKGHTKKHTNSGNGFNGIMLKPENAHPAK